MAITKLQDAPIIVGSPVDIGNCCNQIRLLLSALPWVSHPYFMAERFIKRDGNRRFYYPETYTRYPATNDSKYPYHRLTADNDYDGMFFFFLIPNAYVNRFNRATYNFLSYEVAIIFSVNLERIDNAKLLLGNYVFELMRDVRRVLTDGVIGPNFQWEILRETNDLRTVYREFELDEIEEYNRLPLQCFRFDIRITFQEECIPTP